MGSFKLGWRGTFFIAVVVGWRREDLGRRGSVGSFFSEES